MWNYGLALHLHTVDILPGNNIGIEPQFGALVNYISNVSMHSKLGWVQLKTL